MDVKNEKDEDKRRGEGWIQRDGGLSECKHSGEWVDTRDAWVGAEVLQHQTTGWTSSTRGNPKPNQPALHNWLSQAPMEARPGFKFEFGLLYILNCSPTNDHFWAPNT